MQLSKKKIQEGLTTSFLGQRLLIYKVVDSTNHLVQKGIKAGEGEGFLVVAKEQLLGRGRHGRSWYSRAGGLYLSFLLRPPIAGDLIYGITFLAALVLIQLIRSQYSLPVMMKWPNDLQLKGKKLAGLLTIISKDPNKDPYLITGLGLNVNQREWPKELEGRATSLQEELGRQLDLNQLLVSFLNSFEEEYLAFMKGEMDPLQDPRLIQYSSTLGQDLLIRSKTGEYQGRAIEITKRGSLMVLGTDGQYREFFEGDVSIRRR